MKYGRTLASALIGAAIGLGLHLALRSVVDSEATWFAIIIGALTGLAVRFSRTAPAGYVSYARGAIAAIIALVAILSSQYLVQVMLAASSIKLDLSKQPKIEETVDPSVASPTVVENTEQEQPAAATEDLEPAGEDVSGNVTAKPATRPRPPAYPKSDFELPKINPWDFLFIAVGVFLAYELARGTGTRSPTGPILEADEGAL